MVGQWTEMGENKRYETKVLKRCELLNQRNVDGEWKSYTNVTFAMVNVNR